MLESLLDPWRWERSFQDFPDYLGRIWNDIKGNSGRLAHSHGNRYLLG